MMDTIFIPPALRTVFRERIAPRLCEGKRLYGKGLATLTMSIAFFPFSCGLGIYLIAFASQYSKSETVLSKNSFRVPGMLPQYTGEPIIKRSASLIFSARIWASSLGRTQGLSGRHFKHPIQGLISKSCIRTVSTRYVGLITLFTSSSKVEVTPFFLGLAFMINTFTIRLRSLQAQSVLRLREYPKCRHPRSLSYHTLRDTFTFDAGSV